MEKRLTPVGIRRLEDFSIVRLLLFDLLLLAFLYHPDDLQRRDDQQYVLVHRYRIHIWTPPDLQELFS